MDQGFRLQLQPAAQRPVEDAGWRYSVGPGTDHIVHWPDNPDGRRRREPGKRSDKGWGLYASGLLEAEERILSMSGNSGMIA
jgi:hypothetical protein